MSITITPDRLLATAVVVLSCACNVESDSIPASATRPPEALTVRVDPALLEEAPRSPSRRQHLIVSLRDDGSSRRRRGEVFSARRPRDAQETEARIERLTRKKRRILAALDRVGPDGYEVVHEYRNFALIALEVDEPHLEALREMDVVEALHADQRGEAALETSTPFIGAPLLHSSGDDGSGTAIAVIDSPIRYWSTDGEGGGTFGTCPERRAWATDVPGCAVIEWVDAVAPTVGLDAMAMRSSHGTQIGAMALGVAPGADLLSINVFRYDPASGAVYYRMSDVIAALDWVADHAAEHDIVAVNLSLGGNWPGSMPCDSLDVIPPSWPESTGGIFPTAYFDPIRTLWVDHGISSVAATGNGGSTGRIKSPSCVSLTLSVAALFDTDLEALACGSTLQIDPRPGEVACFSNINRTVDIVAPGVWINAAGFSRTYGTSNAAPHVSGALALLQSHWQRMLGGHLEPVWAHRRLMLEGIPIEHDGSVQRALSIGARGQGFDEAFDFPGFYRAESAGTIPNAPFAHEEHIMVSGAGINVNELILYVEVVHDAPEDVLVQLTAPSGAMASVRLPGGGPSFNAILGRDVMPGAFDSLSGEAVDGTWTLSVRDEGDSGPGFYLSATAFVFASTCSPDCSGPSGDRECGDDRCGGICGACMVDELCSFSGECVICVPSCGECGDDRCGGSCSSCDDGAWCNGGEHCVEGICNEGLSPCQVPDALHCTTDCDETTRACNAPTPGACVIDEICAVAAEPNPSNPCQECNPTLSPYLWSNDDTNECTDGDACTDGDSCQDGDCTSGPPVVCDDETECTDDRCDGVVGCVFTPNVGSCTDGDACTSEDQCSGGVCVPGEPIECDDDDICTDDTCDSGVGCLFIQNTIECDDGDACTLADTCADGLCRGAPESCDDEDVCTDDFCDSATGCQHVVVVCDDDDLCTDDTCEAHQGCVFLLVDCADGDACTDDSCDPREGCLFRPLTCDDHNPCTEDACDATSGCVATPAEGSCSDGDECTEGDACQDGVCQPGSNVCEGGGEGCECDSAGAQPITRATLLSLLLGRD